MKIKNVVIKIKQFIKNLTLPLLLEFIKWKAIDLYRFIRYRKTMDLHLFGIYCFAGLYGQGKTVCMTREALKLRKKYGDRIYICSNYGLGIQDFPLDNVQKLLADYDKPIIFFIDELQTIFPANDISSKFLPQEILDVLSFNRKGFGKRLYWSSQDHELVSKGFRRMTIQYGECRTRFGRYSRVKWYFPYDYQNLFDQNDVNLKMRIKPIKTERFVQTDYLRSLFNSYKRTTESKIAGIKELKKNTNKR